MKNKIQIRVVIVFLLLLGIGSTFYKINVLGFSFSPDKTETVWTVESEITFDAQGGPVKVSLNSPDNSASLTATDVKVVTSGYAFKLETDDGVRRGIWSSDHAQGPQKIYYRTTVYRSHSQTSQATVTPQLPPASASIFSDAYEIAADALIKEAKQEASAKEIPAKLLHLLNSPQTNDNVAMLLEMPRESGGNLAMARDLLLRAKIPARISKGILLSSKNKRQKMKGYLEVYDGTAWLLINPKTAELENSDNFLLWQSNDESLLEVEGGSNSKVRFSSVSSTIMANKAAIDAGLHKNSLLVDFSIYSLPIADQNTFKLLLLIPFGALVVVILRNLVGIRTSGTFMPILIALTFLQTTLLTGLFLFLAIVSIGLLLRSYLSKLNLLLVPRISAVLVFVIVIFLAIAVTSHKLGSDFGLTVTFFPMIIISWTIERMCILWEEEGAKEVLIQGGGSLFTASLIYLLMMNRYLAHLTYSFPELLLVLLSIILMIGSYTGYRLSELRRFEPMAKE